MNANEIVEFAKKLMIENGISRRGELNKADSGLCSALIRRKLLDQVFAEIEKQNHLTGMREIIEAVNEF